MERRCGGPGSGYAISCHGGRLERKSTGWYDRAIGDFECVNEMRGFSRIDCEDEMRMLLHE